MPDKLTPEQATLLRQIKKVNESLYDWPRWMLKAAGLNKDIPINTIERLKAENTKLVEALEFYADENNWDADDWGTESMFRFYYKLGGPGKFTPAWTIAKAALEAEEE